MLKYRNKTSGRDSGGIRNALDRVLGVFRASQAEFPDFRSILPLDPDFGKFDPKSTKSAPKSRYVGQEPRDFTNNRPTYQRYVLQARSRRFEDTSRPPEAILDHFELIFGIWIIFDPVPDRFSPIF